jgi:hypothetical protein
LRKLLLDNRGGNAQNKQFIIHTKKMVGLAGLEPTTKELCLPL